MCLYFNERRNELSRCTVPCYCADKGLSCLKRILRKTEVLQLKKLKAITSKGLKSITSRTLRYVNLSESVKICDEGLMEMVSNCPNIDRLNVCELDRLTDKSLTHVAKTLGNNLVSCLDHRYGIKVDL